MIDLMRFELITSQHQLLHFESILCFVILQFYDSIDLLGLPSDTHYVSYSHHYLSLSSCVREPASLHHPNLCKPALPDASILLLHRICHTLRNIEEG